MPLMLHTFSIPKHRYVFDGNSNSILSISDEQYSAFQEIEKGIETPENQSMLRKFQERGFCCEANIKTIRHPNTDFMEAHLERKILQATLQVTQRCNLRCDYCAYSGQYENRSHLPKRMEFETAKRAIDMVLSHSEEASKFVFGFYGGEPLLDFPMIKDCVTYIRQEAPSRNISFAITTNGTLLTQEVYEYLVNNDFGITVSLDGPKPIHDLSRKFPNGGGSYDIILENINTIRSKYPESESNILINSVVSPEIDESCLPVLFNPDDVFFHYNTTMNFVNDLYSKKEIDYSEVFSILYGHEICKLLLSMLGKLKQEHISPLTDGGARYIREYKLLKRIEKLPEVFHPSGPCVAGTTRLFIDADGRLFPCERVSENSEIMIIGDLENGFDIEKVKALMNPGQTT